MFRKLLAALVFVAVGVLKLPLEERVASHERDAHLVEKPLGLDFREQLGQEAFAASLGGLRSLVASITYLQAYDAWENVDWGKVDTLMTLTTRLQPREESYWDEAAWHMASNAASWTENNSKERVALRDIHFHDYVLRGVAIINEGLQFLPKSHLLHAKLGMIYRDRLGDPRRASEEFLQAYALGAKDFYERFAAYEMVKLGDRPSWEHAYQILIRHYNSGRPTASMLRDIPVLEQRLGIPVEKRIKPELQIPPELRARIKVPSAGQ